MPSGQPTPRNAPPGRPQQRDRKGDERRGGVPEAEEQSEAQQHSGDIFRSEARGGRIDCEEGDDGAGDEDDKCQDVGSEELFHGGRLPI